MGSKGSKGASSTKSRSRADSQKLGSQASHGADKDDRVAAHIAMVETMQKQMQQMDDKIKAISTQNEALQGEVALLRSETRLREPPPQSQTNDNVAPVSVSSPKSARLEGPSRSRLEDVIITTDQGDSVLREQVYGLSRNIGLMQNFLSIDNLRRMLKGWRLAATEEARSSAAENIRNHYVRNCTLLVSDMSGFTRITKEDGICHFLMLTKQMQAMCIPLIESFGGTLVKVEADNLFVIFSSPHLAVMASMHCQAATMKHNEGKRKNDQLLLSMSVVHGPLFHIPGVDLFGGIVPMGFQLGEDLAGKSETLVMEPVVSSCQQLDWMRELVTFEKVDPMRVGDEEKPVWRAKPDLSRFNAPAKLISMPIVNPQVNSEEPVEFLTLMEQRIRGPARAADIDERIKELYTERCTVLVIDLHFEDANRDELDGDLKLLESVISLKTEAEQMCKIHFGQPVASMQTRASAGIFALFPSSAGAFAAATDFAALCFSSDRPPTSYGRCSPSFGLAVGEVLNLGYNNAFGDAINVAFKLGEDVSEPAELLIHADVVADIEAHAHNHGQPLRGWSLTAHSVDVSGVTLSFSKMTFSANATKLRKQSRDLTEMMAKRQEIERFDLRRVRASTKQAFRGAGGTVKSLYSKVETSFSSLSNRQGGSGSTSKKRDTSNARSGGSQSSFFGKPTPILDKAADA